MEQLALIPENLYLYSCGTHRIFRYTQKNNAPCSHCGKTFKLLATVQRNQGESDTHHQIRTLQWKEKK